jgi:hypothetical protein
MSELMLESNLNQEKRHGRGLLLLLLAMFSLPLLIVGAMYQFHWHPDGGSHGQLVSPPQALSLAELKTLQGKAFGAAQWKNKWSLVYIGRSGCDADCEAQLHGLRQIHAALDKEIGRAQRILLVTSGAGDESLARIQAQYPDLIILAGSAADRLAGQFAAGAQPGSTWLVDPLGNLMMRYPPGFEPRGMYKDLMRLMAYSWVG